MELTCSKLVNGFPVSKVLMTHEALQGPPQFFWPLFLLLSPLLPSFFVQASTISVKPTSISGPWPCCSLCTGPFSYGSHRLHAALFRSGHSSDSIPCHPNENIPLVGFHFLIQFFFSLSCHTSITWLVYFLYPPVEYQTPRGQVLVLYLPVSSVPRTIPCHK